MVYTIQYLLLYSHYLFDNYQYRDILILYLTEHEDRRDKHHVKPSVPPHRRRLSGLVFSKQALVFDRLHFLAVVESLSLSML